MRYVIGSLCLFLAVGLTVQAGEIDAKKLVGTWESSTKGGDKIRFEFTKDGKVHVVGTERDKELKRDGTYEVKKDKISVTFEKDGKSVTSHGTIERLSADALVIQPAEEKGMKMEFKRVK